MKRTAIIKSLTCLSLTLCASLLASAGPALAATVDLPRTGQQTCSDSAGKVIACAGTGQDGDKQAGNPWPVPRFTDNNNGTATDNLTGLVWLKNADCFSGRIPIGDSLTAASTLAGGACGLSDGSKAGDWRLPNINELRSLLDYSRAFPPLPAGHPFYNIRADYYSSGSMYSIYLYDGQVMHYNNVGAGVTWPVRGGQ